MTTKLTTINTTKVISWIVRNLRPVVAQMIQEELQYSVKNSVTY